MSFKLPDSIASTMATYSSHIGVSPSQLSAALGLGAAFAGVYMYMNTLSTSPAHVGRGPGPKGIPILGNAADLPKKDDYKVYADWAKKYGTLASRNSDLLFDSPYLQATSSTSQYLGNPFTLSALSKLPQNSWISER
jgi:hypothetical protein